MADQQLAGAVVHAVHVDLGPFVGTRLANLLDTEERARKARLPTDAARALFEAAHAVTRLVLARYLGVSAGSIRFRRLPRGKPVIAAPASAVSFNVSHSGERALIAVCRGSEVGIDIERERPTDALSIARRFFAPPEADALALLPLDQQLPSFYRCWVRKESLLKATGDGFACPMDSFDVGLAGPASRTIALKTGDGSRHWTIADVPVASGYAAALTIEGSGRRIHSLVCSSDVTLHEHLAV